jgi:TPR repeat protein
MTEKRCGAGEEQAASQPCLGFLFVSLTLAACAGSRAPTAPPQPPPGATTAAEPAACRTPAPVDPYLVEWPSDKRADLEIALKHGPVAVRFTCDSLDLLPDCTIDGRYAYAGATEREQVLHIDDADTARANLAFTPADTHHPAAVDIALATVGKQTSSVQRVLRSDLHGDCSGATHFVRSALLGAFAMQDASASQAKTASDLFSTAPPTTTLASPTSSRDGSLDACRNASPTADTPPPGCSSPLRLELRPIADAPLPGPAAEAAAAQEEDPTRACPPGTRPDDTARCIPATASLPHVCTHRDIADCALQCERGSMGSCASLGRSYQIGRGVPLDRRKGLELLTRACDTGVLPACGRIGEALLKTPDQEPLALDLLTRACTGGWIPACTIAGEHALQHHDKLDVAALLHRACTGGDAEGCWTLGRMANEGIGLPKSEIDAKSYFKLACDGGARFGCVSYAKTLDRGTPDDAARSAALLRSACDHGYSASCAALGAAYLTGRGVPRDTATALTLLQRACDGTDRGSCLTLGLRYEQGIDTAVDLTRAQQALTRACEVGIDAACDEGLKLAQHRP